MKQVLVFFCISLFLISCSSTKSMVKSSDLKDESAETLLESLYDCYGNYDSYRSKLSVNVTTSLKSKDGEESQQKIHFNGTIRIQKDSIIWINIAPLMIGAIRCKLTPDSVYFVNKINKTYYAGNYSIVNSMLGFEINYKTMQSILLNELCVYPFSQDVDTVAEIEKYSIKKKNDEIQLQNKMKKRNLKKSTGFVFNQTYRISTDYIRIQRMQLHELIKDYFVSVDYKDFKKTDSITFPKKIHFFIKSKQMKIKVDLKYSKQEFNNNQSYPFNINPRYSEWKKN